MVWILSKPVSRVQFPVSRTKSWWLAAPRQIQRPHSGIGNRETGHGKTSPGPRCSLCLVVSEDLVHDPGYR